MPIDLSGAVIQDEKKKNIIDLSGAIIGESPRAVPTNIQVETPTPQDIAVTKYNSDINDYLKQPSSVLSDTLKETVKDIVEPNKKLFNTVASKFYGSWSNTANNLDWYADKLAKTFGSENKGKAFSGLASQWKQMSDDMQKKGITKEDADASTLNKVMEIVGGGIGSAGADIPKFVAGGMAPTMFAEKYAESNGNLKDASIEAIKGLLLGKTLRAASGLPSAIKYPAMFAAGAATTPGSLEERVGSGITMAALSASKSPTMAEYLQERRSTPYAKGSIDLLADLQRMTEKQPEVRPPETGIELSPIQDMGRTVQLSQETGITPLVREGQIISKGKYQYGTPEELAQQAVSESQTSRLIQPVKQVDLSEAIIPEQAPTTPTDTQKPTISAPPDKTITLRRYTRNPNKTLDSRTTSFFDINNMSENGEGPGNLMAISPSKNKFIDINVPESKIYRGGNEEIDALISKSPDFVQDTANHSRDRWTQTDKSIADMLENNGYLGFKYPETSKLSNEVVILDPTKLSNTPDQPTTPGRKVSAWYENVKKNLPAEAVANKQEFEYDPQSFKVLDELAGKQVDANGIDKSMNDLLSTERFNDAIDGRMVWEINKRLADNGSPEAIAKLRDFSSKITPKMTSAGRVVKSFDRDIYSPEKILITQQKIIGEAEEGIKKGATNPTKKMIKQIGKIQMSDTEAGELIGRAKKIQEMPEGMGKYIAEAELTRDMLRKIPTGLLRKISTAQTIAQLLNVKTTLRNLIGNSSYAALDGFTQSAIGVPIDYILSKFTGGRTIATIKLNKYFDGLSEHFREGIADVKRGTDTTNAYIKNKFNTELDAGLNQFDFKSGTFYNKIMASLERATGYAMQATDRAFFGAKLNESVDNQIRAMKIKNPTPTQMKSIVSIAMKEAQKATFRDLNVLSKTLSSFKKTLNLHKDWGFGDIILKYPKTPANIIMRGIEYSPIGLGKGIFDLSRIKSGRASQRDVSMEIARGVSGTLIGALGYGLAKAGLLTGSKDDKNKVAQIDTVMGKRPNSIKIGDNYFSLDWLQPLALPLFTGVSVAENLKKGKPKSLATIGQAVSGGAASMMEQPVLTGISRFFSSPGKTVFEKGRDALSRTMSTAPGTFIPTVIGQLRYAIDPIKRDIRPDESKTLRGLAEGTIRATQNKIPGLSQKLPAERNVLGDEINYSRGLNRLFYSISSFVNPAIVEKAVKNHGVEMMMNVFKLTGNDKALPKYIRNTDSLKLLGREVKFTTAQRQKYQEILGNGIREYLKELSDGKELEGLDPKEQANILMHGLDRIGRQAKRQLAEELNVEDMPMPEEEEE